MCGRTGVDAAAFELDGYFGEVGIEHRDIGDWLPGPDVYPGQTILVARRGPAGGLVAGRARWGLVPPGWVSEHDPGEGRKAWSTFNARVETAATAPTWRDAWAGRPGAGRCLVFATHWYEYTGPKGQRQPVRLSVPGHRFVAMAGLCSDYRGALTAAVVTCPAAEDIAWVHDRMPLILHPSAWTAWLAHQPRAGLLGPPPPGVVRVEAA